MSATATVPATHTVRVVLDEHPMSPREHDNLGVIVTAHSRYALGDEQVSYAIDESEIATERGGVVLLPIFMLDHSGLTLSTTPFSCPWDSGQVGWIYATREAIKEAYGVQRITAAVREQVIATLIAEVTEYDAYVRGEAYGYEVVDALGEVVDSCWGYFCEEDAEAAGAEAIA